MTRSKSAPGEKPLFWVASCKADLLSFPEAVKDAIGTALSVAQFGGKHPKAKPWKGEGPGVFEVVEDFRGDTYRALYTVKFGRAIYVLHAFQKKAPKGIKDVPKRYSVDLTEAASRAARLRGAIWQTAKTMKRLCLVPGTYFLIWGCTMPMKSGPKSGLRLPSSRL